MQPDAAADVEPDTAADASADVWAAHDSSDAEPVASDVATTGTAEDTVSDAAGPNADTNADTDTDTDTDTDADTSTWRSSLYPPDWTPALTDPEGRYLHDFSYAGYHHGEADPTAPGDAVVIDVVADHGAVADGTTDATAAIQAAIDAAQAAGGAVVYLPPGLYRCDGGLTVTGSDIVLRGAGPDSRLWFTASTGFDYSGHLRFTGAATVDVETTLAADAASRMTTLEITAAAGLEVGDDVQVGWVITDDFIARHGMADFWEAFNGTWQPFFHRTVVAIEDNTTPPLLTLDVPLRYAALVEDGASVRKVSGLLRECGVEDLAVANAVSWEEAWAHNQIHAIAFDHVTDCWVRGLTSFPSPGAPTEGPGAGDHLQSSGLNIRLSKRVTVRDSFLERAQNRGGGGNGYLFEVRQSSEVLFADCEAAHGRHNFIQNWGFGTSGIVWLRVHTRDGKAFWGSGPSALSAVGASEFHHSLATANLIDSCVLDDAWKALNRFNQSTGAGHTATETAFWNNTGSGKLHSHQYGWGYVIGTGPELQVEADLFPLASLLTEPADLVEGLGAGGTLQPTSLYEDQLARRLGGR